MLLQKVPELFLAETAPRLDKVEADFEKLFGATTLTRYPPGVYVSVRDGHIDFTGSAGRLDLGPAESSYLAEGEGSPSGLCELRRSSSTILLLLLKNLTNAT